MAMSTTVAAIEHCKRHPRSRTPCAACDRLVRRLVTDLLTWSAAEQRAEREATHGASPLHGMLETLKFGVLGSGCRGTKGVGRAPVRETGVLASADPALATRYHALSAVVRATCDAIIGDGRGDQNVDVQLGGRRTLTMSLRARIGWRLSSASQVRAWMGKITTGHSPPAISGAERVGSEALIAAAEEWERLR